MWEELKEFIYFVLVAGVLVISSLLWYSKGAIRGYKNGQVDALTGRIKYELVTNSDSSKSWYLITKKITE